MKKRIFLLAAVAALAGCGQSSEDAAAKQAHASAAQPKKKPAYCFFKDKDMKGMDHSKMKH